MLKKFLSRLRTIGLQILAVFVAFNFAGVTPALASALALSPIPLYSASGVPPNLVLTFDDSGSMTWGYLPDSVGSGGLDDERRGCSSEVNKIYFNPDPAIPYDPPVKHDGTPLNATPTSFTAAYIDGFNPGAGTVNLATSYRATWDPITFYGPTFAGCGWSNATTLGAAGTGTNTTGKAAFYFTYNGTACGANTNNLCYTLVQHNNGSAGGAWTAAQQQKFANWYSYYRTRNLAAKTATGRSFANLGGNIRVAGQHLNNTTGGSGTGIMFTTTITNPIRQFCNDPTNTDPNCPNGSTARSDFFTRLYNSPASGGTPLRQATQRAGNYFSSTTNNVYRDDPTTGTTPERSCRQNFHILMTDGFWNGTAGVATDADDINWTLPALPSPNPDPDPYPYIANYTTGGANQVIYREPTNQTLADNAFHYWATDLRPDLTNNVPRHMVSRTGNQAVDFFNPKNDPAVWQHMVNYTIGLGIDGNLAFNTTTYNNLLSGAQTWPAPVADTLTAVDDLWHAAVNSRGAYFSAKNPEELVNSLTATLNDLGGRSGSAAAAATSAFFVGTGSTFSIYQSGYNSSGWYGHLRKFTGTISGTPPTLTITGPDWDAGTMVTSSGRKVITYNPSNAFGSRGVAFAWGNLNASQQDALSDDPDTTGVFEPASYSGPNTSAGAAAGQARVDYLRGVATQEGNVSGFNFRARTNSKLGDINSSAPQYVGQSSFEYSNAIGTDASGNGHAAFVATTATRTPVIYVGANDGMLHGFNANTGAELFGYVPNAVYRNLKWLTTLSYQHKFYVDGSPVYGDVFYGGSWKTMLVGGLNAGGQGIYALNITDPTTFTEANAGSIVRWEFTDANDADLGYTFGEPVIARVRTSAGPKWVAIFGNGYNNTEADGAASTTGHAALYVVNIENGNLIKKISTLTGDTTTPNGLAGPSVVDWDGDVLVDYVYAGDLRGNMWKFDLTSNDESTWRVFYGTAAAPAPLFTAVDGASPPKPQPITVAPEVTSHPSGSGNGFLVYFGTGKMLEVGDSSSAGATTQTVYGIWDKNQASTSTPVVRADLLAQTVIETGTRLGIDYRNVSNNPIIWRFTGTSNHLGWRLDLPSAGEKQVTNLDLKGGHLIFTTYVPSTDPCLSGGDGWQMELDYRNGGRLATSPFDTDLDGLVCQCANDNVNFPTGGNLPPAGRRGSPIQRQIIHGPNVDWKLENPLSGSAPSAYKEAPGKGLGRQSWRQIK